MTGTRLRSGAMVGSVLVSALVGLVVWHTYYSSEAFGRPPYFERLVGVPFSATDTLVACGEHDTHVYAFHLPSSVSSDVLIRQVTSGTYPRKADYQSRHALVPWHAGPPQKNDWKFVSVALDGLHLALSQQCASEERTVREELYAAVNSPTSWLSYSYMATADRVGVLSFFVLDLDGRVLYDVEYAP